MNCKCVNNIVSKISASQLIPENLLLYNIENAPYICQVEINPIDYCNHNCKWCFTAGFRSDKKIPLIDLKKYLRAFYASGGKSVVFSGGGEPLLYREIYSATKEFENKSICKFLIEKEIFIGIITNGQLLEKLFNCDFSIKDLAFIRVSLDATNGNSHSYLHGTSSISFERIIKNIQTLLRIRGELFTPAIGISFVVDSINNINFTKKQIEEINKLACDLNVDFVQFKHIHTSEKKRAIEGMKILHSHCIEMNWNETEFWVQSYTPANKSLDCLITQYIQSIGKEAKRFPCCHLFGRTEFLKQKEFLPKGEIISCCSNKVCRYNEMNNILLNRTEDDLSNYKKKLESSMKEFGFHPYRYCPTAPNILKPFNSK